MSTTLWRFLSALLANNWAWEWSWGPLPTAQSAKIFLFALRRDGTMNINPLLAFESQKPRLRGPEALNDEHLMISPSLPSQPRLKRIPRKTEEKEGGGKSGHWKWRPGHRSLSSSPLSWALGSKKKTCTVPGDLKAKGPGPPLVDSEEVPCLRVDLGEGGVGRLAWHSLACGSDRKPRRNKNSLPGCQWGQVDSPGSRGPTPSPGCLLMPWYQVSASQHRHNSREAGKT